MILVVLFTLFSIEMCSSHYIHNPHKPHYPDIVSATDDGFANSDMVMAFVVFRHGDRTPDQEELDKFPTLQLDKDVFYPYGKKALTNKGKQRAFRVGQYLRKRYDGLISKLYLPEEVRIQTTDYARTEMTALTVLSGLYPPPPIQRWKPDLNWQPIPYETPLHDDDSLLHFVNCPRYLQLKNEMYELPKVQPYLQASKDFFKMLSKRTGNNITTPEDVFFLDNLFQTLSNVDVPIPQWAQKIMPLIKQMTKIEYALMFYTDELKRMSAGGLLFDIFNATKSVLRGNNDQPKLFIYSAHENNVASLLAASRAFTPHQPNYGSTASLELWRNRLTGKYSFAVVYAAEAGGPSAILPVAGCGGGRICDYDIFLNLTSNYVLPHSEYQKHCHT